MSDPRVQKFAKLLAHYSIYAQPREIIGVEGPDTAAPLIERALAEQGLVVTDLREIESSLEDVFISVLTRREPEESVDDHRN